MNFKQVIVVRTDLKMSVGKTCAQVAHASLGSAIKAMNNKKQWFDEWTKEGQKKVVLKVNNKEEIFEIYEIAKASKLPCYLVNDAGLTELEPGTTTTLGIGPGPNENLDKITGELKLLS